MHLSDGVRGPPLGVYSGAIRVRLSLCCLARWPSPAQRQSALRRGGGGHSSMASARCTRGAETVHSAVSVCPHSSLARHVPPYPQQQRHAATASGAGRRLLATASASAPPRPATARLVVFSHQRQRQWALLADNETAQELQRGCGDDCWRSASLAALHARPLALH